jgi:thioesterase domain-containing protein
LAAFLNGASLFPFDLRLSGGLPLARWLIQEQITLYHSVPTVFRQMAAALTDQEEFLHLRAINLSGAPMSRNDVERYKNHFSPHCTLLHMMGATETGWMRGYFINKATEITGTAVPVGYAIADKEVSLIGDNGRKVSFNEIGEITVKSRYLSVGYWRKPDLTSAKFLPDPTSGDERTYLTGDLGRLLPDGCLEHLGRKDFQVKIRGHRIELGEIEALLLAQDNVREAAVVKQELAGEGNERLVAYIVPAKRPVPTIAELRHALRAKLPDYMVPTTFVFLDDLPLTPNGKVDRNALPKPDQSRAELATALVQPRTAVEKKLAKIWAPLLGLVMVGIYDNFFDLGGNSLLGSELTDKIEKAFDIHITPAALFQAPTIAQLAGILRREKWSESCPSLVPLQPNGSKPPFFWVHGDYSCAVLPRYLGPDQPLYGLAHQGQDGTRALYTEVETIAGHYLEEIRTVQLKGPYFLGGYSFGGTVAFEIAQQLKKQSEEVALLFMLDSHFPGDDIPDSPKGSILSDDNIYRHLHNVDVLQTQRAKLAYILVRVMGTIKGKINEKTARIRKILKKGVCKVYLAVGRRIPLSLRSFYILEIYYKARRNYKPRLYPGAVIYVKSENRSTEHRLNWAKLIAGGLEIHEIPVDHLDLTKESAVRVWADPLITGLQRANESLKSLKNKPA